MSITLFLEGEGYEVITAEDGVDALKKLNSIDKKVDLIIVDINMPNMDGITLIREVKKLDQFKFTPIIVETTETQVELKAKGKEAGATGWITKPFSPEQLLAAIRKVAP